jgi:polyisoprenoid-binding protein YceI
LVFANYVKVCPMTSTATELGLAPGAWRIDPAHSEVTFVIRHLMSKVRGSFTAFTGSVEIADDLAASTVTAEVDMSSIDTRNADRDTHLRASEIFDVDDHPTMGFVSTGLRRTELDGELTVRGVTRPLTLDVEFNGVGGDPWGGTRAGFTATGQVSRKEFGIEFNIPMGGDKMALGDRLDITLEIQAVQQ